MLHGQTIIMQVYYVLKGSGAQGAAKDAVRQTTVQNVALVDSNDSIHGIQSSLGFDSWDGIIVGIQFMGFDFLSMKNG
jgi:hypothetical protein